MNKHPLITQPVTFDAVLEPGLISGDGLQSVRVLHPDKDLAFFMEGEPLFDDYVEAVSWAQDYARENREAMMSRVLAEMRHRLPKFQLEKMAVNCHHNYVQKETHGGVDLLVTRKGAVSARAGELGIIPGSMGAKSFIVRGKGNADSFHSCSHGAGGRQRLPG